MAFLFGFLLLVVKSALIVLSFILAAGVIRLLVFGSFKRCPDSLTDSTSLRKGDILLTGKQSVFYSFQIQLSNVLTRKLKHRFWTHAALYQGNGKVWEAQPEGIIEKDLSAYLEKGFVVRGFRHRYLKDEKVFDEIINFCAREKGAPFDWRGITFYTLSTFVPISFNWFFDCSLIDKIFQVKDSYFCSELVIEAFKAAGHALSAFDGWRVKPADFIGNPFLEEIHPVRAFAPAAARV